MKATLEKTKFASALARAKKVIDKTISNEIFKSIKLEASGDGLTIIATDLKSFIKMRIPAVVEQEGATVARESLSDIVSGSPAEEITIDADSAKMIIQGGKAISRLPVMKVDDYVNWPKVESVTEIILTQSDLKSLIKNTVWAIPDKDPREVLQGILFNLVDGYLVCCAMDGYVLGEYQVEPIEHKGPGGEFVIHHKQLKSLMEYLGDEGEAKISLGETLAVFEFGSECWIMGRLTMPYLKYQSMLPSEFKYEATVDRAEIIGAVERAGFTGGGKSILKIGFGTGSAAISSSSDAGIHNDEIISWCEKKFGLEFQYSTLLNGLKGATGEKIKFGANTLQGEPVILLDKESPGGVFMAMSVSPTGEQNGT